MRSTVDIILEESGPENLPAVEWLAAKGHYISAEELAVVIESNPGQPLPDRFRDYLCRFLRGQIQRKRGRKTTDQLTQVLTEFVVRPVYGWYLTGDPAMRDDEGYYWSVGRADETSSRAPAT
jgi:acyl-CoA synthetase (AMP-forming)/AMP-acid ligase II